MKLIRAQSASASKANNLVLPVVSHSEPIKKQNMLLLCTDSLRGYGLNRIFELAKQANYDGIDLSVDFGEFDTYNTQYLKRLVQETGMSVYAVSAPQQIATKKIEDIVVMAKDIGAKVVILQPPKILDFKLAGWLKKEIPKMREKYFLSIALENAPAGTFLGFIPEHALNTAQDLREFKHVSLDTSRLAEQSKDLMRAYNALKKFLVHVHLSNFYHGKKYGPPQEGIMPLESFLTKLKQEHYPGAIAIKILPKYLQAGEDEKVIEELAKAKKYYDKYFTNVEVQAAQTPQEPSEEK